MNATGYFKASKDIQHFTLCLMQIVQKGYERYEIKVNEHGNNNRICSRGLAMKKF